MASKLKIIPLGGISEIGKNMTVIEYGKDMILVDCGSMFPGDDMPGIDLVIPDMDYLEKNAQRLRAIVITHGHEDHIGAVPYALKKFSVPVYGSRLSLALINHKLEEHGIAAGADLRTVQPGDTIKLGCISVEFIHVNHSIAGSMALAITTPAGVIIHTGDFKIDYTSVDGAPADLPRFAEYGRKGVLCLMSDSTNAELPGYTLSESMVGDTFERYFDSATGRIIVATFASNIHRIQQVCDCALRHGRKVCFQGRSMLNISALAAELGYLNVPERDVVDIDKLKKYRDDQICVITTGSQGEPMSGLSRMAGSAHKLVIGQGDLIIVSASAIPGNEKSVSNVINQLCEKGATVIYKDMADVHVSGHARQEEQKLILALTKPKYFIPVHGEYRHLMNHIKLAESLGVPAENCMVVGIGEVAEFTRTSMKKTSAVSSGSIMIDGSGVGDIGNIVLRDRKLLSEDGLVVVVVSLSKKNGKLLAGPDVITRGFVYVRESEELIDEAREVAKKVMQEFGSRPRSDWSGIKNNTRGALKDFFYKKTKRNPVILPIIQEV